MTVPTYLPYYVLIGAIAIIAIILFGLRNALAKADWSKHDRATAFRFFAVTLISWFLLALVLGLAGVYKGGPDRIPTIQYGIFIPLLIGGWLIWRSPALGRIIDAVPQPWIVGRRSGAALKAPANPSARASRNQPTRLTAEIRNATARSCFGHAA